MSKRSTSFPARWMSTYEACMGDSAQRVSLGYELAALPYCCPRPDCALPVVPRSAQARLSPARALCQAHRFFSPARKSGLSRYRLASTAPRTSFFMVNHVNLFDPFILYCAIPQLVRRGGSSNPISASRFYGWLMKRFGNVPCAQACASPKDLKRLWRLTAGSHPQRPSAFIVFSRSPSAPAYGPPQTVFRRRRLPPRPNNSASPSSPVSPRRFLPPSPPPATGSSAPPPSPSTFNDTIETKGLTKGGHPRSGKSVFPQRGFAPPVEEVSSPKDQLRSLMIILARRVGFDTSFRCSELRQGFLAR